MHRRRDGWGGSGFAGASRAQQPVLLAVPADQQFQSEAQQSKLQQAQALDVVGRWQIIKSRGFRMFSVMYLCTGEAPLSPPLRA